MPIRKTAALAVLDAWTSQGASRAPLSRVAHRVQFSYTPRPGYLYVRSRAISSRCNDNWDEFPADEIEKGWKTFLGKPAFVNHHNANHRRARGVIIAGTVHRDHNPDSTPDTWVELLHEIDAVRFPKLAEAILKGRVNRTSMGVDVERSTCSACGNVAESPAEYCRHIPQLKGKKIRKRNPVTGKLEEHVIREICAGLSFFENSFLVEDPADPTAYVVGQPHLEKAASLRRTADVHPDAQCPSCGSRFRGGEGGEQLSLPHGGKRPARSNLVSCHGCGEVYDGSKSGDQARVDREVGQQALREHWRHSDEQKALFGDVTGRETQPQFGFGEAPEALTRRERLEHQNLGPGGVPLDPQRSQTGRQMYRHRRERALSDSGEFGPGEPPSGAHLSLLRHFQGTAPEHINWNAVTGNQNVRRVTFGPDSHEPYEFPMGKPHDHDDERRRGIEPAIQAAEDYWKKRNSEGHSIDHPEGWTVVGPGDIKNNPEGAAQGIADRLMSDPSPHYREREHGQRLEPGTVHTVHPASDRENFLRDRWHLSAFPYPGPAQPGELRPSKKWVRRSWQRLIGPLACEHGNCPPWEHRPGTTASLSLLGHFQKDAHGIGGSGPGSDSPLSKIVHHITGDHGLGLAGYRDALHAASEQSGIAIPSESDPLAGDSDTDQGRMDRLRNTVAHIQLGQHIHRALHGGDYFSHAGEGRWHRHDYDDELTHRSTGQTAVDEKGEKFRFDPWHSDYYDERAPVHSHEGPLPNYFKQHEVGRRWHPERTDEYPNMMAHHDPNDRDTWTNRSACSQVYRYDEKNYPPEGRPDPGMDHDLWKRQHDEDHAAGRMCPECGAYKWMHAQYRPSEVGRPNELYRERQQEEWNRRVPDLTGFHPLRQSENRLTLLGHFEKAAITGEQAEPGHDIWAVPQGRSPVSEAVHHNMETREPGDHGETWYHGIPHHGPYFIVRHPETRSTHVVDAQGRDASPTGGGYGNRETNGSWGESQAEEHWRGLESAGPDAGRTGTHEQPSFALLKERTPAFPHSRIDPEDVRRAERPDARVHKPEGYSPEDEYHGSYEVVKHPETGKFHVVDNAGRHAPSGAWRGFGTQMQGERSRDYIERRQRSKEIGRGIAESIFSKSMDVLDPGGTEESRQSERNTQAGEDLMGRYAGGRGKIKFDDDEDGGAPYYEREHHLDNGKPSGWYARHYGGAHTDIYHRATGDEAHDTIHLPQHPEDESVSMTPRLHPDFDDISMGKVLKEWHDEDPDTGMGDTRSYLERSDPRIQRWKRRHQGARYESPADHPFFQANPVDPSHLVTAYHDSTDDEKHQGHRWYADAHEVARALAGGDAAKGAGVVAAYSPQTNWPTNLFNAARSLREGRALGPGEGQIMGSMQRSAQRIISGEHHSQVFGAPKISAFAHLIEHGDDPPEDKAAGRSTVVVDRHALSAAIGRRVNGDDIQKAPLGKQRYYDHVADAYRSAANFISHQLGREISPHQLQATVWLRQQRKNAEEDSLVRGKLSGGVKGRQTRERQDWTAWGEHVRTHHPDVTQRVGPGNMYQARKTAVTEDTLTAPPYVDTLRQEECPVCGQSSVWAGQRCPVCGYVAPPSLFRDPDTSKAMEMRDQMEPSGQFPQGPADEAMGSFPDADGQLIHPDQVAPNGIPVPVGGAPSGLPQDENEGEPGEEEELLSPEDAGDEEEDPGALVCPACSTEFAPGDNGAAEGQPCPACGKALLEAEPEKEQSQPAGGNAMGSGGAVTAAVAAQQRLIEGQSQQLIAQRRVIASLQSQLRYLARLAGVEPQLARVHQAAMRTADINNPGSPVPDPPASPPTQTTEEALASGGYEPGGHGGAPPRGSGHTEDDPSRPGTTPGSTTNVPAAQTTTAITPGVEMQTPPATNLIDVTSPVQGTGGDSNPMPPIEQRRVETDVRVDPNPLKAQGPGIGGQGNDGTAFPWVIGAREQQATGQPEGRARVMASIRLARLRIGARMAQGDELDVAGHIERDASLSMRDIEHEIGTLSAVMRQMPQRAPGRPRPRTAARSAPSLAAPPAPSTPSPPPMVTAAPKAMPRTCFSIDPERYRAAPCIGGGEPVGEYREPSGSPYLRMCLEAFEMIGCLPQAFRVMAEIADTQVAVSAQQPVPEQPSRFVMIDEKQFTAGISFDSWAQGAMAVLCNEHSLVIFNSDAIGTPKMGVLQPAAILVAPGEMPFVDLNAVGLPVGVVPCTVSWPAKPAFALAFFAARADYIYLLFASSAPGRAGSFIEFTETMIIGQISCASPAVTIALDSDFAAPGADSGPVLGVDSGQGMMTPPGVPDDKFNGLAFDMTGPVVSHLGDRGNGPTAAVANPCRDMTFRCACAVGDGIHSDHRTAYTSGTRTSHVKRTDSHIKMKSAIRPPVACARKFALVSAVSEEMNSR